jgi:FtsZ-interacting cell division protein ZipA
LLVYDKTGQQQSRLAIQNYKIRSMNEELKTIEQNLDLFFSADLLKIRSAELSDAFLSFEAIRLRACAMCEAEAKRKQEELDANKKRSEEQLQAQIDELKTMLTSIQDMMSKPAEPTPTRDGEDTPPVETVTETPTAPVEEPKEEEQIPEVPPIAEVQKTRMGEKPENYTKQELKNRIKF